MFPRISSTLSWICLRNPEQNKATIPNQSIPQVVDFPFVKEKQLSKSRLTIFQWNLWISPFIYPIKKQQFFSIFGWSYLIFSQFFPSSLCGASGIPAQSLGPQGPFGVGDKGGLGDLSTSMRQPKMSGCWCDVPILKNDGVSSSMGRMTPHI